MQKRDMVRGACAQKKIHTLAPNWIHLVLSFHSRLMHVHNGIISISLISMPLNRINIIYELSCLSLALLSSIIPPLVRERQAHQQLCVEMYAYSALTSIFSNTRIKRALFSTVRFFTCALCLCLFNLSKETLFNWILVNVRFIISLICFILWLELGLEFFTLIGSQEARDC